MSAKRFDLELAQALFRQLPWGLTANAAVMILVVAALWAPERGHALSMWASGHVLVIALRATLLLGVRRRGITDDDAPRWAAAFAVGAGLSGLLWGAAAVLFVDPAEPTTTIVVAFALGGMAAGGVTTLSFHAPSFSLFLVTGLAPLAATLAAVGDRLHLTMATMVVVFALVLFLIAGGFRRAWFSALRLSDEKQRLLETLEQKVVDRTAALTHANLKLHRTIAERLRAQREAQEARAEAERANLAKTKFLAAASHDLRQPVQSLSLLSNTIAAQLSGHPALPLAQHLDRTVGALRTLLDSLLDISRLDAGGIAPNFAAVPVGPLLERLAHEYALRAADRGLDLRRVPTTAWCVTDPVLLDRILRNLIENAVRYTAAGRILIGCRRRRDRLVIQVLDTGVGIAEHQLDAIFQEFFQAVEPTDDGSHGLGLGLAIVSRLGQTLGHRVEVSSELGRGSCFSVTLALATPGDAGHGDGKAA